MYFEQPQNTCTKRGLFRCCNKKKINMNIINSNFPRKKKRLYLNSKEDHKNTVLRDEIKTYVLFIFLSLSLFFFF